MSPKWYFSRWLARLLAPIVGLKIVGREKVIKKGPLIIAANHTSYLDPPLVGYAVDRECFFMAKLGLFKVSKFFAWLIKFYNAFPIVGIETIRRAIAILNRGQTLVIFPEGTRSANEQLLPFHPGVSFLSRKCRAPVIPVYIENSRKPFLQIIKRRYRLKITIGTAITPPLSSSSRDADDRFVNQIRDALLSLSRGRQS